MKSYATYRPGPSRLGVVTQGLKNETLEARLLRRSEVQGICRVWLGSLRNGYGVVTLPNQKKGTYTAKLAHRAAYEVWVGPIPKGLTLDHLCRNRSCIEPAHLEPVTTAENIHRGVSPSAHNRRKTHCQQGHLLSGDNLKIIAKRRLCRICQRVYQRDFARAKRLRNQQLGLRVDGRPRK